MCEMLMPRCRSAAVPRTRKTLFVSSYFFTILTFQINPE